MNRVIALDAATETGWAYRRGKVMFTDWKTGTLNPHYWEELDRLLRVVVDYGVTHAAIEDCYLGVNPQTHKVLAVCQGLIISACDRAGLPYEVIPAATWHADLKITGKRAECKRGAMHIATKVLGALGGITQDEADAVCLCDVYERTLAGREVTG